VAKNKQTNKQANKKPKEEQVSVINIVTKNTKA